MPDKAQNELFSLRNVRLSYGNLMVLKKVNFALRTHEIHALVGEHGAGKSSLARIISGFQSTVGGSLFFQGLPLRNYSPREAKQKKIEIVRQDVQLFDKFTIAHNIMIANSSRPFQFYNRKKEIRTVSHFLRENRIDLDPMSKVRNLNLSDRIMVAFLKHVYNPPQILILDETLEHLSNKHLQKVIPRLRELKKRGASILFITHRIDDIYEIADRVSIIRDGKILVTEDIKNIDKINLIKLAYTQVIKEHSIKHMDFDFYNLLKYNEAILTKLPFSLIVTDTRMKVRLINDAAGDFFNIPGDAHPDVSLKNLFGTENAKVYYLLRDNINQKKENYFYDIQITTKKVSTSQNIGIIPLYDGKLFIGNIITLEDMTEYQELQRRLSLSENLSSIGLLATGVAHEINNPLEIINYYIQNLRLKYPDNSDILETVREVDEEIGTISDIIDNLLMFSENKQLELEEVELNHLLSMIIKLLNKLSTRQNIILSYDPYPEPIYVHAAKTELKQVFLNILKNSFEAINEKGSINVKTDLVISEKGAQNASIVFSDTGPGVDEHIIKNLFMPFFSTKQMTTPNMGLGLSIAYNIITKYDGTMTMKNRDSIGCETAITLPTV